MTLLGLDLRQVRLHLEQSCSLPCCLVDRRSVEALETQRLHQREHWFVGISVHLACHAAAAAVEAGLGAMAVDLGIVDNGSRPSAEGRS